VYIPPHFAVTDEETIHKFLQEQSFGTLVTSDQNNTPFATHLPLVFVPNDQKGVLLGHIAKASPQAQSLGQLSALAIFLGPHAYISPRYYKSDGGVPTWNYMSVHVYGELLEITGDQKAEQQQIMTRHFEGDSDDSWSTDRLSPKMFKGMLSAITSFELKIHRMEAKWKLNQNLSAEDQQGAIDALSKSDAPLDRQIAAAMADLQRS
jgi:transcriptional regulator